MVQHVLGQRYDTNPVHSRPDLVGTGTASAPARSGSDRNPYCNPTTVSLGQTSTQTWNSTNATSCAGGGFAASTTSGATQVLSPGTTTYSLTCTVTGGGHQRGNRSCQRILCFKLT
jgi:hypothetical protein